MFCYRLSRRRGASVAARANWFRLASRASVRHGTAVITLAAASGGLVTRCSYTSSPDLVAGSAVVSQGLETVRGVFRMHPQLGPAVLGPEGDRLLVHRHHR